MNINTSTSEVDVVEARRQVTDVSVQNNQSNKISRSVLSWKTSLSFGVGHVLNDLCASMWFTYLLVFFHLVLRFDNSLSGIILLIGQIADGIATPFVGLQVGDAYSNQRTNPNTQNSFTNFLNKIGPRKTWHLIGTLAILISFPFIFMPCVGCSNSSQWAQVIYFAGFIVIFQFGWAAVQVSHLSLIPVLAHDERSRTELTALRYAFTVASNITIYTMTWVTLGVAGASQQIVGPDDAPEFRDVVLIAVGVGAFFSIIFHMGVNEVKENQDYHSSVNQSLNRPPVMKAFDWLKEKQFYQVAVLYMSTRLFVNLSQIYLPLWLQDNLQLGATSVATTPLALFVSGFLTSLAMGCLTQVVGRKKDDGGDEEEEDDDMDDMEDDDMDDDDDEDEDEVEVKKAKKPSMEKEGYKSDAQRKAVWASRNEKGMKEAVRNPYAIGMATAMKSSGDEPPLEKSTITKAHKIAKSIMKKESTVWNWDQILEASDEELDSLIEQLNDEDFDSFAHEFYEFTEMYAKAKQGVSKEGQEKLEPRAPAEKAFVNMHRRVVSDEPEGIVDRSAVKAQSPIRAGDKRSGEPMKTVKPK